MDVDAAASFGKRVFEEIKTENVPFMAAAITYQAFVSLVPVLVLLFFVLTLVGDQALARQVVELTKSFLPAQAQQYLKRAITGDAASPSASVIGIVTLVWGAFRVFKGLDTAFSEIFDTEANNGFVDKLTDSAVVFVALGGALLAAVLATVAFSTLRIPFIGILGPVLLVIGLSIAFFPMYYLFPDLDLDPLEVLPGVFVGAVGWTALQSLFQGYLTVTGNTGGSVVGAVLLLMTWFYFSGLILLLGAVVNAVRLGRAGDADSLGDDARRVGGERVAGATRRDDERERRRREIDADLTAADVDRLRERYREIHRERERLQRERRELRVERRARADADEGTIDLRRRNRDLRRRVRWCEKPLWKRLLWRGLDHEAPYDEQR